MQADVAAILLEFWHLPAILREAARGHYDLPSVNERVLEAGLVHVANAIVARSAIGGLFEQENQLGDLGLSDALWQSFGLNPVASKSKSWRLLRPNSSWTPWWGLAWAGVLQTAEVCRSPMSP